MDVLRVAVGMVLSIVLPLLIQLWDRNRLRARGQEAPWNFASWGTALYAFGPLSMLAWSHLSRPRPWRWVMGPAWCAALLLIVAAASSDTPLEDGPGGEGGWVLTFAIVFIAGALFLMLLDGLQALWRALRGGRDTLDERRQHGR